MNYLMNFVRALVPAATVFVLLGLFSQTFNHNDTVVQNITVEYLERILEDLKADDAVSDDATICDVDWDQFGIVLRLDCKTRIRADGPITATPEPVALPRKQDVALAPQIEGAARIQCDLAIVLFPELCESIRANTYSRNLAAPWEVDADDICNAVLRTLQFKTEYRGAPCETGRDTSEITVGGALGGGRDQPEQQELSSAFISVQKGPSDAPVFSISMISSPEMLDSISGENFFERVDFLLFWTFEESGEFDVKVETLLVLQGQIGGSLDAMRAVKAADRLGQIRGSTRRSRVRPAIMARRISDGVQSVTELVRNSIDLEG